jgi:hypothetical protein
MAEALNLGTFSYHSLAVSRIDLKHIPFVIVWIAEHRSLPTRKLEILCHCDVQWV